MSTREKTPERTQQPIKQKHKFDGEPVASDMCFDFPESWKLVVSPSPLLAKVGIDVYVLYPVVHGKRAERELL